MAEYIDREAVLNRLRFKRDSDIFPRKKYAGIECAIAQVKTAPTADVVEVRHGVWVQTEEPLGWRDVDCIECSSCHESWIMDDDLCLDDYTDGWKYCPNCGAKMDGKGEGE